MEVSVCCASSIQSLQAPSLQSCQVLGSLVSSTVQGHKSTEVGLRVGVFVGSAVGFLVDSVGNSVGWPVGSVVGFFVGLLVGKAVGRTVGCLVGISVGAHENGHPDGWLLSDGHMQWPAWPGSPAAGAADTVGSTANLNDGTGTSVSFRKSAIVASRSIRKLPLCSSALLLVRISIDTMMLLFAARTATNVTSAAHRTARGEKDLMLISR
jgi:hypothetical protein